MGAYTAIELTPYPSNRRPSVSSELYLRAYINALGDLLRSPEFILYVFQMLCRMHTELGLIPLILVGVSPLPKSLLCLRQLLGNDLHLKRAHQEEPHRRRHAQLLVQLRPMLELMAVPT